MFVKSIQLHNYRNHQSLELKEIGQINLITGANAVGKSNLIEAILRFNGYNKQKDSIISFGKNDCTIGLEVESNNNIHNYRLVAAKSEEKNKIEKKQPLGPIPIVHFGPDEGNFFSSGPQDRRYFLDSACATLKKKYQKDLLEYQRIVRQKNNHLKEEAPNKTLIDTLNHLLVSRAVTIIKQRLLFIEEISSFVQGAHNKLIGKKEEISINYVSKTDTGSIENSLFDQLKERRGLELIRGCCMVGPQRDDFSMALKNIDIGQFGSQGEKKTASLSLKMGQIQLLRTHKIKPILILDDALSELDPGRRQHLLDSIDQCDQTFITATDDVGLNIDIQIKRYRLPLE